MGFTLRPGGNVPDWFTFFLTGRGGLQSQLNRADGQNIKCLRYDFTKADANTTISLGAIPANAIVDVASSGVWVHEVFNAGTNNKVNIGTAAATGLYATGLSLLTLGFKPLNAAVLYRPSQTAPTELKFFVDVTGVAATTGKASVIVKYMVQQEA